MEERGRLSDEELLVQYAASGKHELLAELFARWRKPLLKILQRYYRSTDVCDDAVQEAFLSIHRRARQFRADAKASSWIMQIARNKAADAVRRRRRDPFTGEQAERILSQRSQPQELRPADDAPELLEALPHCVNRLPAKLRAVLWLTDFAELSYGEVSRRLAIPVGSVKSRRHRAIELLRQMMLGSRIDNPKSQVSNLSPQEAPCSSSPAT